MALNTDEVSGLKNLTYYSGALVVAGLLLVAPFTMEAARPLSTADTAPATNPIFAAQPAASTSPSTASAPSSLPTTPATTNATNATTVNPWGCAVRADNPHNSDHIKTNVAGSSTSTCSSSPPYLETQDILERALGLGIQIVIASNTYEVQDKTSATANAGEACPVNYSEYVNYGYGYAWVNLG